MNQENFKVKISPKFDSLLDEVYIYRVLDSENVEVVYFESEQVLVKTHKLSDAVKPSMVLHSSFTRNIIKAFTEAGQKIGIELPNESMTKGKLEAQSAHLKDLRTLLKLK